MSRIPVSLDPFVPRALRQRWEGELGGDELPRVRAAALEGSPISVRVGLSVVQGALGEIRFQGTITGAISQQCQRCLQPMTWRFRLEPDVVLVDPAGPPPALGDDQEMLELGPEGLRPAEFVEEEILLALPLSPRHQECQARLPHEFEAGSGDRDAENPFAVLQELRKNR
nr:YceD family protein [Thioalkalivibrio sp.]